MPPEHVLGCEQLFAEIDVALFLVDAEHLEHLLLADAHELLDGADALAAVVGRGDEAFNVVVLEQAARRPQIRHVENLHHDHLVRDRILRAA